MSDPRSGGAELRRWKRVAAVSIGIGAGLLLALIWVLSRSERTGSDACGELAADADARAEAVRALVAEAGGVWDGHPDPEVVRVLQPGLEDRRAGGVRVTSNAHGMREREFEVPKPNGRTRIVLLGDSYVFGNGVEAEDRLGVHLESMLREEAPDADVEVLHAGITDWNLRSECAWLRRTLSDLRPDLVVHVLIWNDLDDTSGARGFGALAGWTSQDDAGVGTLIACRHPYSLGFGGEGQGRSLLHAGLDHESRERYARAGTEVARLAEAVERTGGRYLALLHWPGAMPIAHEALLEPLRPEQRAYLASRIFDDGRYRVSANDPHWNRDGHELVAELLHAVCVRRGLLPGLASSERTAARTVLARWYEGGRAEAEAPFETPADLLPEGQVVRPYVDLANLDRTGAAQVHGGLWADGSVSPYASVCLANPGARTLVLTGSFLDRPELEGGATDVYVDERLVGTLEQQPGEPLKAELEVPAELSERPFVSVRLASDDWAQTDAGARRSVALQLDRIELL